MRSNRSSKLPRLLLTATKKRNSLKSIVPSLFLSIELNAALWKNIKRQIILQQQNINTYSTGTIDCSCGFNSLKA